MYILCIFHNNEIKNNVAFKVHRMLYKMWFYFFFPNAYKDLCYKMQQLKKYTLKVILPLKPHRIIFPVVEYQPSTEKRKETNHFVEKLNFRYSFPVNFLWREHFHSARTPYRSVYRIVDSNPYY